MGWLADEESKTPLAIAISRFRAAGQSLAESLAAVNYPNEWLRGRLSVVASDVENTAELLEMVHEQAREAYGTLYAEQEDDPVLKVLRDPKYIEGSDQALVEAWQAAMASVPAEAALERSKRHFRLTFRPTRRLAAAYKSFFMFVRAYQDAVYCLLLETPNGSMGTAIKNASNPVRTLLDEHLPGYVAWFLEFRNLRNKIKYGFGTALSGVGSPRGSGGMGLIVGQTPASMVVYHLSDAAKALEFSSQITDVTGEVIRSRPSG